MIASNGNFHDVLFKNERFISLSTKFSKAMLIDAQNMVKFLLAKEPKNINWIKL
tara:strand:+ start:33 stop:194 length:162 start_codon:yes stop_codon:yes gene_type:complete